MCDSIANGPPRCCDSNGSTIVISPLANIAGANGNVFIAGNILASNIYGTISTPYQPLITTVGILSNLVVAGRITASGINVITANFVSNVYTTNIYGTVMTPAQPFITTVGTLTSLNVAGTSNVSSLYGSHFYGDGSGLSGINGSNVTGVVQSAHQVVDAAQPNITSVGTLTSVNVTGVSNLTALTGSLMTSAQPNITSTGILTSLNVSGNSNVQNLWATNIYGTVSKASQPLITSLGNLTSLTTNGLLTTANITGSNGNVSVTGNLFVSNLYVANIAGFQLSSQWTSNPDGNIYFMNSVGIGTSLPLSNLEVVGNALITDSLTANYLYGTLRTANQNLVTNVGTLGNLAVTGNIVTGNISGNGWALSNIYGSNILGPVNTAYSVLNPAQPNITSVGNLTGLTVNGNFSAYKLAGDGSALSNIQLANTIGILDVAKSVTANAQPNITSVGTLTGLTINGVLQVPTIVSANGSAIGNLNASNLIGPVATAASVTNSAQPNITSVGTLTSLTVTGQTLSGSFAGVGSGLSSIPASNVVGIVPVAASVSGTSQSNITSVGTLDYLNVFTKITANLYTGNGSGLSNIQGSNVVGVIYSNSLPPSGVNPGSYGSISNVSQILVDIYGRVTSAQNTAIVSSQWTNVERDVYLISNVAIGTANTTLGKLTVDGNVNILNSFVTQPGLVTFADKIIASRSNVTNSNVSGFINIALANATFFGAVYENVAFSNITNLICATANLVISNTQTGNVSSLGVLNANIATLNTFQSYQTISNIAVLNAATVAMSTSNISNLSALSANVTTTNTWTSNTQTGNVVNFTSYQSNILGLNVYSSNTLIGNVSNLTSLLSNITTLNAFTSNTLTGNVSTLSALQANIAQLYVSASNITTLNTYTSNTATSNVTSLGVLTGNVATLNVYTSNTATGNVTTLGVLTANINSANLVTSNLVSANVSTLTSLNSNLAVLSVTTANIVSENVLNLNASVSNITTANLATANVTTLGVLNSNTWTLNVFTSNTATGNVTTLGVLAGNVSTLNVFTSNTATGNVTNLGVLTANINSANITGANISTLTSLNSNITTLNVSSSNTATSNVTTLGVLAGNVSTLNVFTSNTATGNVTTLGVLTANINSANLVTSNLVSANISTLTSLNENVTTLNVYTSNTTTGNVTTLGVLTVNINSANLVTSNLVSANISTLTSLNENVTTLNVYTSNTTTGNVTTLGVLTININSANLVTSNLLSANVSTLTSLNSNVATLNVFTSNTGTGNVTTLGVLTANINSANLVTSNLVSANVSTLTSLNSNISTLNVNSSNTTTGNVTNLGVLTANINSANLTSANISVLTSTNSNISTLNVSFSNTATANVTTLGVLTANINSANLVTSNLVSANISTLTSLNENVATLNVFTSNTTTGNVTTLGVLTGNVATLNVNLSNTVTSNVINFSSANSNVGTLNVLTSNTATANITSLGVLTGNVTTLNVFTSNTATGNVTTLGVLTANINSANLVTSNLVSANVSTLTSLNSNLATLNVYTSNTTTGNITSLGVVNGNIANFTSTNSNITTLNVSSSNTATGNVTTLGVLTANINSANLVTSNLVSANVSTLTSLNENVTTLNVYTSNLSTANVTSLGVLTGNVATLNVNLSNTVTGNVTTLGVVTGNVSTLNVNLSNTVTGNITSLRSNLANISYLTVTSNILPATATGNTYLTGNIIVSGNVFSSIGDPIGSGGGYYLSLPSDIAVQTPYTGALYETTYPLSVGLSNGFTITGTSTLITITSNGNFRFSRAGAYKLSAVFLSSDNVTGLALGSNVADIHGQDQGYMYRYTTFLSQNPTELIEIPFNITDTSLYYYLDLFKVDGGILHQTSDNRGGTYLTITPLQGGGLASGGPGGTPGTQWISSGSNIYYANSVGIGAVNPQYNLDVSTGTAAAQRFVTSNISSLGLYGPSLNIASNVLIQSNLAVGGGVASVPPYALYVTGQGYFSNHVSFENFSGYRNRLINGTFRIVSRANSITISNTSSFALSNSWVMDRWHIDVGNLTTSNVSMTIRQDVSIGQNNGFSNVANVFVTRSMGAVTDNTWICPLVQTIEASGVYDLRLGQATAKPMVFSFYANTTITGDYSVIVRSKIDNTYYANLVTLTNTWNRYTVYIPPCTIGTWGTGTAGSLEVCLFGVSWGSSRANVASTTNWTASPGYAPVAVTGAVPWPQNTAFIQVTGVQIELGTITTPFEIRLLSETTRMCQRYFETNPDIQYAAALGSGRINSIPYVVTKRAHANVSVYRDLSNLSANTNVSQFVAYYGDGALKGTQAINSYLSSEYGFSFNFTNTGSKFMDNSIMEAQFVWQSDAEIY